MIIIIIIIITTMIMMIIITTIIILIIVGKNVQMLNKISITMFKEGVAQDNYS